MKELSTSEVAKEISVSKRTLLEWLYRGKITEPKSVTFGGVSSRVWSDADLERARKYREKSFRKHS